MRQTTAIAATALAATACLTVGATAAPTHRAATAARCTTLTNIDQDAAHSGYACTDLAAVPELRWRRNLGGSVSNAVITGGNLYVIGHAAIRAFVLSSGQPLWPGRATNGQNLSYGNDRLVTEDADGILEAISPATGKEIWAAPTQESDSSPLAVVAAQGRFWVDVLGTLYSVRPSDGTIVRRTTEKGGDTALPAVSGDGVFLSSGCADQRRIDLNGETVWHDVSSDCPTGDVAQVAHLTGDRMYGEDGGLVADQGTGQEVRHFSGMPAFDGQRGYFTAQDTVSATQLSSGAQVWSRQLGQLAPIAPLVTARAVYVGMADGTVWVLDPATGDVLGHLTDTEAHPDPDQPIPVTALGAADGNLVVSTGSGVAVYGSAATPAAVTRAGEAKPAPPAGRRAAATPASRCDAPAILEDQARDGFNCSAIPVHPRQLWTHSFSQPDTPVIAAGRVYVADESDSRYDTMYALSAASGKVLWGPVNSSYESQLLYADGQVFAFGQGIVAVDARTGRVEWRRRHSPFQVSAVYLHGELIGANGGNLVRLRARTGRGLHASGNGYNWFTAPITPALSGTRLYLSGSCANDYAFRTDFHFLWRGTSIGCTDALRVTALVAGQGKTYSTGSHLVREAVTGRPVAALEGLPALGPHATFFDDGVQVYAQNLDGSPRWDVPISTVTPLVLTPHAVVVGTFAAGVQLRSPGSGRLLATLPPDAAELTVGDGVLLVTGARGVIAYGG